MIGTGKLHRDCAKWFTGNNGTAVSEETVTKDWPEAEATYEPELDQEDEHEHEHEQELEHEHEQEMECEHKAGLHDLATEPEHEPDDHQLLTWETADGQDPEEAEVTTTAEAANGAAGEEFYLAVCKSVDAVSSACQGSVKLPVPRRVWLIDV